MSVTIGSLESRPLRYARASAKRAQEVSLFILGRAGEIVLCSAAISVSFYITMLLALLSNTEPDLLIPFGTMLLLSIGVLWSSLHSLLDKHIELVFPAIVFIPFISAVALVTGMLNAPFSVTLALAGAVAIAGVIVLIPVFLLFQALLPKPRITQATEE